MKREPGKIFYRNNTEYSGWISFTYVKDKYEVDGGNAWLVHVFSKHKDENELHTTLDYEIKAGYNNNFVDETIEDEYVEKGQKDMIRFLWENV